MKSNQIAERIKNLEKELKKLKKTKANFKKAEEIIKLISENYQKANEIIIANIKEIKNEVEKEYSDNEKKVDRSIRLFDKYIQPALDLFKLNNYDYVIEKTIDKYENEENYQMRQYKYQIQENSYSFRDNLHLVKIEHDKVL